MAWASGNKRWTLPFVSLNGTECRVDIYKKNYTGSTVTPLTGAAVPIAWDEDDDENLLNVVRVKTGEINVVETNYGDLKDLYPSTNTEHYIEVYYGVDDNNNDKLIFVGFMQAQTFENEWESGPRVLSFNIMSPLGLIDGLKFIKTTTPSYKSLGTLMREVIDGLNANIGYVVFPDPDSNGSMKTYCMFHMFMCSNVITPETEDYSYGQTAENLFTQRTYRDFIEGLCNCFGMIVHDNINSIGQIQLLFSRFDYIGKYSTITKYQLANGQTRSRISADGSTENDIASTTIVSGDENKESLILPLNKIDINYDGDFFESASLSFNHCQRYAGGGSAYEGWNLAYNIPLNGELISDHLISNPYLNSNGRLSAPGVVFAGVGQNSIEEMVLIQKGPGWETGKKDILKWTLYERPLNAFRISFNGKFGSSIDNLDNPSQDPSIQLTIKCGNRYFTNSGWTQTEGSYTTGFGEHTIPIVSPGDLGHGYPIEIWISIDLQYLDSNYIYTIQNFKVETGTDNYYNYVYGGANSDKQTIDGDASEVSGNIDCLFSVSKPNANLLAGQGGNNNIGYPENPYYSAYRYLTVSQNRLQVAVKGTIPIYAYIIKALYFNSNWKWRIIAVGFNPREDEYILTMHRSLTIEP